MKKIFLNFLVIILMVSGLQVNQIKADDTASIIAGSILGPTALGALIFAIYYNRDKIAEKWNDFKNNLGSVKQQSSLTAAQREELFRAAQLLEGDLEDEIADFRSGSQSAEDTAANMVARVSESTRYAPLKVVEEANVNLPKAQKTKLVQKSEEFLAGIKSTAEQLQREARRTTGSKLFEDVPAPKTLTKSTLAEGAAKVESGGKSMWQQAREVRRQQQSESEVGTGWLSRFTSKPKGPMEETIEFRPRTPSVKPVELPRAMK